MLEITSVSFVLPVACEFGMTTEKKLILSSITILGVISSSHLWGFLSDTRGRKKIIQLTLLSSFLCTGISSLVTNFTVFVFFRYLSGFL